MKKIFNKTGEHTQELLDQIRAEGYRLTTPRRAVVNTLAQSDGWLRPETIHQKARQTAPNLGLVTVYRTLQLLTTLGIARRVHTEDGCQGYTLAEHSHGHHLICKRCQHVIEFPGTDDLQPLIKQLEETTGYIIEEHVLELAGVCPECQT
jgi:Fur family ferric uptake transcriptional regulator